MQPWLPALACCVSDDACVLYFAIIPPCANLPLHHENEPKWRRFIRAGRVISDETQPRLRRPSCARRSPNETLFDDAAIGHDLLESRLAALLHTRLLQPRPGRVLAMLQLPRSCFADETVAGCSMKK